MLRLAPTPFAFGLALATLPLVAASPAAAQRLGTPTHSQQNEDGLRTTKSVDKAADDAGEKVDTIVINAGETKVARVASGADAATEVYVLSGGNAANKLKITVTVKGSVTTLRADNMTGGIVGFTIEADPSGSGSWAQAGEVKDLVNRKTSNTDYQMELKAIRLSDFTFKKK